eukprot:NODE_6504_length_1666_cov_17.011046.p1 GENE.NODE_6504_length_1666_cov_17.011046~~NODE_6504_length_1666_cov_17.011046.p1  ORF type:complete len:501 (+),score=38.82 NODE_6504_length_1666_cov_17.011046:212-1504(+)
MASPVRSSSVPAKRCTLPLVDSTKGSANSAATPLQLPQQYGGVYAPVLPVMPAALAKLVHGVRADSPMPATAVPAPAPCLRTHSPSRSSARNTSISVAARARVGASEPGTSSSVTAHCPTPPAFAPSARPAMLQSGRFVLVQQAGSASDSSGIGGGDGGMSGPGRTPHTVAFLRPSPLDSIDDADGNAGGEGGEKGGAGGTTAGGSSATTRGTAQDSPFATVSNPTVDTPQHGASLVPALGSAGTPQRGRTPGRRSPPPSSSSLCNELLDHGQGPAQGYEDHGLRSTPQRGGNDTLSLNMRTGLNGQPAVHAQRYLPVAGGGCPPHSYNTLGGCSSKHSVATDAACQQRWQQMQHAQHAPHVQHRQHAPRSSVDGSAPLQESFCMIAPGVSSPWLMSANASLWRSLSPTAARGRRLGETPSTPQGKRKCC